MRYLWRIPLLVLHVLISTPLACLAFAPGIRNITIGGQRLPRLAHRLWARSMLRIFGIHPQVSGRLPAGACMVVANHITWLDIVLLSANDPLCFVSKAEIRRWPLVGALATLAGTIYIERGNDRSRRKAARRMAARLKRGARVAVFAEGGIRSGPGVGRFHGRLLAAAIRTGVPVVPVALRYSRGGTDVYEAITLAEQPFLGNLLRVLGQPPVRGEVMIGQALASAGARRDELARQAEEVVVAFYGVRKS